MNNKILNLSIIHLVVFLFFLFVHTTPTRFTFLNWNVFLALLPFDFAVIVSIVPSRLLKCLFGVLWLLFFPNTMYMMTDFIHLYAIGSDLSQAGQYFNYAILATGIFIGVGLGVLGLEIMTRAVFHRHVHLTYFSITALVSVLSALGIYIGRYLRLNSWDIFVNFHVVLRNIAMSMGYHMFTFVILFAGAQFAVLVVFHYGIRMIKLEQTQA
ncbi:UNVERIFIED_ORG: putative membrane protein [Leuconostoc holzapfelii]